MSASRLLAVLGVVCLTLSATPRLRAGSIAADALPLPNRVAAADIVIVGKVTRFEDKMVKEHKIAVISVSSALMAPEGTKTVRFGFVPPPPMVVINPPPLQPTVGMEGCFFLNKHGDGEFYVARGRLAFIDMKQAGFDASLRLITRCTKLLQDPNASLKAKDAEDRFLAAAMLVARYRSRRSPNDRSEPIDAERSKQIMQALASADWTPRKDFAQLTPVMVLHKLPLTKKDGWSPPPGSDPKAYAAYAQQWVRDHVGSYRIERFVTGKEK